MRSVVAVLVAAAAAAIVAPTRAGALVLCTLPDGKPYAGDDPPPGCVVKSQYVEPTPEGTPTPQPGATPTPDTLVMTRERERAREREIERRRQAPAVTLENIVNRRYVNGRRVEGTLANEADFPVYAVRICVEHGRVCQYADPPTIEPGGRAGFSFPSATAAVPDWKITWDVVRPE